MPAGTGLDRRTFVARGVGLALAVYGGSALRPQVFDEGIAAAAAAAPQQKVLVSVFLDGGADALSLLAPTGDPLYRQLRPRLALAAGRRACVRRGPEPHLAPLAHPARPAPRRGQGERHAGDRLRPSEPVALHLAPLLGGRRSRRAARDRLARPLPRPRRASPTTRCRASRSTGACSRRSPRPGCPSQPSTPPTATTSGRAASGARCPTGWSTRSGGSAHCRRTATPASRQRATRHASRPCSTTS